MSKLGSTGWLGEARGDGGVARLGRHGGKGMELTGGARPTCQREKREKTSRVEGTTQWRKRILKNVPRGAWFE
jgi:hypothetical protein